MRQSTTWVLSVVFLCCFLSMPATAFPPTLTIPPNQCKRFPSNQLYSAQGDPDACNLREILSVDDEWILEEVLLETRISLSPREDADRSLWLVEGSDPTQTLSVYHEELPSNLLESSPGIFRLSHLPRTPKPQSQTTNDKAVTAHPEHESLEIGTQLLSQDADLKIWEFRILPNESCDFHRHFHPYFFLNLSESLTQELDCQLKAVDRPPNLQTKRQCTYVSREHSSAHGVKNVGTDTFLQFIVEFVGM
jgi:hypothetical protein